MDRKFIGKNFHNLILDMGEDYWLETKDCEEWVGKISMVAKTASSYMMAEREYLFNGTATFPDVQSQMDYRGCYFKRESNPDMTYILVSTNPKDTTPYAAEIYAVGCNATVSLAYAKEVTTERMNRRIIPEIYVEKVPVYWDSSLQKQRRSSDGNFEQSLYYMQIPARFGLALDEIVIRKMPQYNDKTKENEWVDTRFRVEAIDVAMISPYIDGAASGILDVQLSLDTRG